MKSGPAVMGVTVDTTRKCDRWCFYCDEDACPSGEHGETGMFLAFFKALERARNAGYVTIEEIVFTGRGEALMHPDIVRIVREAARLSETRMMTSGVSNWREARRLNEMAPYLSKLTMSHNTESAKSLDRIGRTLRCRIPSDSGILSRIAPDRTDDQEFKLRVLDALQRTIQNQGYQRALMVLEVELGDDTFILPLPMMGLHFVGPKGNQLVCEAAGVSPCGRAFKRLEWFTHPIQPDMFCSSVSNDVHSLHVMSNGKLAHCCEAGAKPMFPATEEGIHQLIDAKPSVKAQVEAAFAAAIGQEVHKKCEICPLCEQVG